LVGREGVGGFDEAASFDAATVDVDLAVVGAEGRLEAIFATGIPDDEAVLLASFKNLFGLPSSHWFTWLANLKEHKDS
jgi:hypothetical protein